MTIAPVPDPPTGALAIVATGGRDSAPQAANVFAKELLAYLDSLNATNYADETAKLDADLQLAKLEASNLDAQIAANAVANPLVAQALQARPGRRAAQHRRHQPAGARRTRSPDPTPPAHHARTGVARPAHRCSGRRVAARSRRRSG